MPSLMSFTGGRNSVEMVLEGAVACPGDVVRGSLQFVVQEAFTPVSPVSLALRIVEEVFCGAAESAAESDTADTGHIMRHYAAERHQHHHVPLETIMLAEDGMVVPAGRHVHDFVVKVPSSAPSTVNVCHPTHAYGFRVKCRLEASFLERDGTLADRLLRKGHAAIRVSARLPVAVPVSVPVSVPVPVPVPVMLPPTTGLCCLGTQECETTVVCETISFTGQRIRGRFTAGSGKVVVQLMQTCVIEARDMAMRVSRPLVKTVVRLSDRRDAVVFELPPIPADTPPTTIGRLGRIEYELRFVPDFDFEHPASQTIKIVIGADCA